MTAGNSSVLGLDGKSRQRLTASQPPRRRSSLPEAFQRSVWDIRRAIERIERVIADDRFARHRDDFRDQYAGQVRDLYERLQAIDVHDLHEAPRRGEKP